MSISRVPPSFWRRHFPYWVAIAVLAAFVLAQYRFRMAPETAAYTSRALMHSVHAGQLAGNTARDQVTRMANSYRCPSNRWYGQRAAASERALSRLIRTIDDGKLQETDFDPDETGVRKALNAYRDSLLANFDRLPGSDTIMYALPPDLRLLENLGAQDPSASPTAMKLWKQALLAQAAWDFQKAARYCSKNLRDYEKLRRLVFVPLLFPPARIPRAGDSVNLQFWPQAYDAQLNHIEVYVDGERLPTVHGLAHFSRVFDRPGTVTLPVVIKIPDRWNQRGGEAWVYTKEYEVEVQGARE